MEENPPITQDEAQQEVRAVKYHDPGVRAIKLRNIAFGGAPRASLIMTIVPMLDEGVRLLYVLPEEHEVLALKGYLDQNFKNTNKDCLSFSTHKKFRVLLEAKTISNRLVVVLDCSRMPLTVDMEICTGLLRDYIEKLADAAIGVVFTALFTESIYHRCQWWEDWSSGSVETTIIHNFGDPPPLPDIQPMAMPDPRDIYGTLRLTLQGFAMSVMEARAANIQQPPKAMLCVIQVEEFNLAMLTFPPDELQQFNKYFQFSVVDYNKKPSDWAATMQAAKTAPERHAAHVVVMDPSIGIMHPMPQITLAYISRTWTMHVYDGHLNRVIYDCPATLTPGQIREQLRCLQGSNMASLEMVILPCQPDEMGEIAVTSAADRFRQTPSVTRDLTSLLFQAHLAWPSKVLPEMPIARLPDRDAVSEELYRLKWFGCLGGDDKVNPLVDEKNQKISRILEKLPDVKLALVLSRIDSSEDPMVSQAIVEMALLLHCGPAIFLLDRHETYIEDLTHDEAAAQSLGDQILEDFDHIGKRYLHSSANVRKGLVFRAWAALQSAHIEPAFRAMEMDDTYNPKLHKLVNGIYIDLNIAKDIDKKTAVVWQLLELGNNKLSMLGLSLSEAQVCKIESHLAYGYLFDLAILDGQKHQSGALMARDISSQIPIDMSQRQLDLLFTPPETDPVSGIVRFSIMFKVFRHETGRVDAVEDLFISTKAVFHALEALTSRMNFGDKRTPDERLFDIVTNSDVKTIMDR